MTYFRKNRATTDNDRYVTSHGLRIRHLRWCGGHLYGNVEGSPGRNGKQNSDRNLPKILPANELMCIKGMFFNFLIKV